MKLPCWLPLLPLLLFIHAAANSLHPPVLPLAVRNPYLSLWYNARLPPYEAWPFFWTGSHVGVAILARVPDTGRVYPLLGRPQDAVSNTTLPQFDGYEYTADTTRLKYTLQEDVEIDLVWTSPITPEDERAQSLPASYLKVKVTGTLGVDIYIDVNGSESSTVQKE